MSLITTASLTCGQCSNSFPLNLNFKPDSISCPFCQTDVENNMIEKIFEAISYVKDLNKDFVQFSKDRKESLFTLTVAPLELTFPGDSIL